MSVKNYASMVNPTGKLKDCLAEILKYSFPSRHICPLFLSIYLPSFGPALVMLGSVLVLARVEAIFIMVACMGLHLGFVLKAALKSQECYSCCWAVLAQSRLFLLLTPPRQWAVSRLGLCKHFRGDTTRTADPIWSKRYSILISLSEHMSSCSVYKEERRRRKGGMFGAMAFVFLSEHLMDPGCVGLGSWLWLHHSSRPLHTCQQKRYFHLM